MKNITARLVEKDSAVDCPKCFLKSWLYISNNMKAQYILVSIEGGEYSC